MKILLVFGGILLSTALLTIPSVAVAQVNVDEEFQCYDANSDGGVDMSDSLRLLNWLFLAQQLPEPCGGVVPICPGEGQDGSIVPGCANDANRFVDNGDGTVTDTCTGLMWQQETGDPDPTPGIQEVLWCDALDYAENLDLGDQDDWRVPDYNELHSIVDHGRFADGEGNFSINPIFSTLANAYWSSTPLAQSNQDVGQEVWAIEFGFGRDGPVFVEAGGVAVRCVRNSDGPSTLPDTGQTFCYDNAGNVIDCESETCFAQDGSTVSGCANDENRFVDNLDGTVTDTCTGLMWQQESGDPDPTPGLQEILWCNALDYADTLTFAGHDDWRVPDITELKTVVDRGRWADGGGNFAIDPIFNSIANAYWSSTPVAQSNTTVGQEAWAIEFGFGREGPVFVEAGGVTVRCVRNDDGLSTLPDTGQTVCYDAAGNAFDCATDAARDFHAEFHCYDANGDKDVNIEDPMALLFWLFVGGEQPESCPDFIPPCPADGQDGSIVPGCANDFDRYVNNGDGTVTDTCTGLMWQQESGDPFPGPPLEAVSWCDALHYAEGLALGGHDDWRVPDINELNSIVDRGNFNFSIDPIFSAIANAYWSSTPMAQSNPDVGQEAWACEFGTGRDGPVFVEADGVTVRCVRDANGLPTLPDTGQTECYDNAGNGLDCSSFFCPGQDGSIVPGCANDADRFVDNGNGTVTDTCTGLMWQQESGDPDPEPGVQGVLWCNALDYADTLTLGDHDDWRVPDINELQSIVDHGRFADGEGDFSIDPIFSALANAYWSSTPLAQSNREIGQEVWAIEFGTGRDGPVFVEAGGVAVRCVRNSNGPSTLPDTGQTMCYDSVGNVVDCAIETGLCPGLALPVESGCRNDPDRFVDNQDGTVTDTCTGLMWQQESNISFEWCVALDYANSLNFGGHSDWRMPNIRELYSIVDYSRLKFTDPVFSVLPNAYWSSTHTFAGPSVAWAISFATGTIGPIDVSLGSGVFVRAVRNISTLPDTGQNLCYDSDEFGTIVDCFDPTTCPGQDGFHDTGCPNDDDRFVDNLDGTVTDTCTGLMWQQKTADADNDGMLDNFNGRWCEAIAYADDLIFPEGEHDDWRLPSIHELQSLVDYGRATNAMDPLFTTTVEAYWSSTPRLGDPNQAWAIEYNGGTTGTIVTFGCAGCGIRVRVVRDAP